jgi:hypothetical protein
MSNVGKSIFKYLKKQGKAGAPTIATKLHVPLEIVEETLNAYVKSGFIGFDQKTKEYSVKFYLDPPLKPEPTESKFWNYENIKETQRKKQPKKPQQLAKGGAPPLAAGIPRKWRNPYLNYLPDRISQGGRGTCCGYTGAIGETLKYYKLTGDMPTPEEIAAEQRNVEIYLGCANNEPFVHDKFNKRWKSAQYIYETSRIYGNVTEPAGSYVSAVAGGIKVYGSVFETECYTSLSAKCVDKWYPRLEGESTEQAKSRIIASGKKHPINGFAQILTFEGICEAVYTHGSAMIPINIYANYTSNGCVGNYPDPRGEVVGSHAQCIVGYDLDAGTLEFRQSWGKDWSNDGGISRRYYDIGAGATYVILDDEETIIGEELYTKITVSANVPCNYTINGETHAFADSTVMLETGVEHIITATPLDPSKVVESFQFAKITPVGDSGSVVFSFTMKPVDPEPTTPTWAELLERLKYILKKILAFLLCERS